MGKRKNKAPPRQFAYPVKGHYHFIQLDDSMLNSPAYIALSLPAKAMYTVLRQQYKGDFTGMEVVCTYKMFMDKGISRNSIPEGIRLLVALGFITYESGGLGHIPNRFFFSAGWQQVRTKEEAAAIKREAVCDKHRRREARKAASAMSTENP